MLDPAGNCLTCLLLPGPDLDLRRLFNKLQRKFEPDPVLFPFGQMKQTPEEIIRQNLGQDERLLWSGKPWAGITLRPPDLFLVPLGLFWCASAIFWGVGIWSYIRAQWYTHVQLSTGTQQYFTLFIILFGVIPFFLVGIYFVFGRIFLDAKIRERTTYGVSNHRVLIVSGLLSQKVKSLQLRTPEPELNYVL